MTDTTTPPPGPPYYQLTHTTHTIVLTEAPDAGKRLGNGYRRILPDEMKVTVYRPGRPVRLTGLDDRLQPAGVVLATSDAPGGAGVRPNRRCAFCGLPHAPGSYEGECLL